MSWTCFGDTIPKAQKEYRCDICNEVIGIGEKHVARRGAGDGQAVTMRMHLDCEQCSKTWDEMEWQCHLPGDCTRAEVRKALQRRKAEAGRADEGDSAEGIVGTKFQKEKSDERKT